MTAQTLPLFITFDMCPCPLSQKERARVCVRERGRERKSERESVCVREKARKRKK